jgi:omega-amidase
MKISIIQSDIKWEDKSHNLNHLGEHILSLNGNTDIVVLPEMFNSGFSMNTELLGESPDGTTFSWMAELAQNGNFGICGSYIVKENNTYFNRWVFVSPEKEAWFYNKRHLFTIGGEDKYYTHGKSRLIFNFRGIRISPFICYDLRFPVWNRNKDDYDLAIYSANWPEARINVWNTLLQARAIENQCYVAGSNRIGTDGKGIKYPGSSLLINPRGEIMNQAHVDEECTISAELSLVELNDFRSKFPVAKDADDFAINLA